MLPIDPLDDDSTDTMVSRRRMLASVGLGALGLSMGIPTVEGRAPEVEVSVPDRRAQQALRREAFGDDAVDDLLANLGHRGWRRSSGDTVVLRSEGSDFDPYHVVAIALDRPDGDGQAVVLWTDEGPFPAQAREFIPIDDPTPPIANPRSFAATQPSLEMRATVVDGGDLTTETITFEPEFWWYFCSDLNWSCVLAIAGAWASAIAACAACVADPTKITCLSCIGAVLSATGTTLGCDWCEG